jgi:hypothetical protein
VGTARADGCGTIQGGEEIGEQDIIEAHPRLSRVLRNVADDACPAVLRIVIVSAIRPKFALNNDIVRWPSPNWVVPESGSPVFRLSAHTNRACLTP